MNTMISFIHWNSNLSVLISYWSIMCCIICCYIETKFVTIAIYSKVFINNFFFFKKKRVFFRIKKGALLYNWNIAVIFSKSEI